MNNVIIGDDSIKYYDEILKISNISRTWIFKFENIEKKRFEKQMQDYSDAKYQYEREENQKKKDSLRNNFIAAIIVLLISILCFSVGSVVLGFLALILTIFLVYIIYKTYIKSCIYPYQPPREERFPDKYGLGIEMNSGHKATFTAIGREGITALRKLQNDIEKANVQKGIIYFNLGDNNITVENNDGVINTGDFASNQYQKGGENNL